MEPSPVDNLTLGKVRVRPSFNPSENPTVREIKQQAAALIDLIELWKGLAQSRLNGDEAARCCSLAQTSIEEGAMWAVKAVTDPVFR